MFSADLQEFIAGGLPQMEQLAILYENFCNKRDQAEVDFENKGRNEFEYTEA